MEIQSLDALTKEDRQQLLSASNTINEFIRSQGKKGWYQLDHVLAKLIQETDFERIVTTLPIPITYYRLPVTVTAEPACVVLFIFKIHDHLGRAVLFNTYNHHMPNDKIYKLSDVINRPIETTLISQTPPHTHSTLCHSCVAWTKGSVEVTEQRFEPYDNHQLRFIEESILPSGGCALDDKPGEMIHSICVRYL